MEDVSASALFPDDDHALGPFLGNLPPEILDAVVQNLGWFRTAFALAGKTCREVVDRVPSTRARLTERELLQMMSLGKTPLVPLTEVPVLASERLRLRELIPLAVAVMEADVEAMVWLMQLFDGKGLKWRDDVGIGLSVLAAGRGKFESLTWVRANGCPWDEWTCAFAAGGGHLEVLQWARQNGCPWNEWTCSYAAHGGHLEVLQWARENGCPWGKLTWDHANSRCRPYLIEHGCPGAE